MANELKIGPRIQGLRKERKLTLQALAEKCDCTRSLLSKIENGKAMPAVATIARIAEALQVETSDLFVTDRGESLVSCAERFDPDEDLTQSDTGYHVFPFAKQIPDKVMQPFMFVARKGEILPHALRHAGEEFIYVLSGKMKYQVGEKEYMLRRGDSLYFSSTQIHSLAPVSKEVRYLAVFVA